MDDADHLLINDRERQATSTFLATDKLFVGFDEEWLTGDRELKLERIRFPDFSCNWSRFSHPVDVRKRKAGCEKDGCYSFTVIVSRFNNYATPVHDPIHEHPQNYSHVEIRALLPNESVDFEPPKNRPKGPPAARLAYRQNLLNKLSIELLWSENPKN